MRLLEIIEQEVYDNGILLINSPDMKKESMTLHDDDGIGIFIKPREQEIQKRVIRLSHELSHYYTYTYYDDETKETIISKYEYQADSYNVARLLPPKEILQAVWKGCCYSVVEIAEYVDYPPDFVDMAINIYQSKGELPYKHEMPEEYFLKCVYES